MNYLGGDPALAFLQDVLPVINPGVDICSHHLFDAAAEGVVLVPRDLAAVAQDAGKLVFGAPFVDPRVCALRLRLHVAAEVVGEGARAVRTQLVSFVVRPGPWVSISDL